MRCLLRTHQTEASVPEPCMTTRLVRGFFFFLLQHQSNDSHIVLEYIHNHPTKFHRSKLSYMQNKSIT